MSDKVKIEAHVKVAGLSVSKVPEINLALEDDFFRVRSSDDGVLDLEISMTEGSSMTLFFDALAKLIDRISKEVK